MPTYEYRCEDGHTFEVIQRMTDEPVETCLTCSRPVQRVFHPVAVHFKGKGFYNTDYGTRRRQRELAAAADKGSSESSKPSEGTSSSTGGSAGKSETTPKPSSASSTQKKS